MKHIFILALMLSAARADARIATPSFSELAHHSACIATGRVLLVLPTPFSPVILLAAAALLALFVVVRSWRPGRRRRASLLGALTLFSALLGVALVLGATEFTGYHSVALFKVERAHRGSIQGVVPVFFRTSHAPRCRLAAYERAADVSARERSLCDVIGG